MSKNANDYTLPLYFDETFKQRLLNLEVFDTDTWVISFPRSGTTWTQEMVWLIGNSLDYDGAKTELQKRFPEIELSSLFDASAENIVEEDTQIQNGSRKPKIVYVVRNPKDVCNSYYKHNKLVNLNKETFEEFCELFLQGKIMYTPYWKQVRSYWEKRHQGNILFLRYEDMIQDLPQVIRKVASFLNKNVTEKDVEKLHHHLTFDSMKKNEAVNRKKRYDEMRLRNEFKEGEFIRNGKIGDHKKAMSPDMIKKFDQWIAENIGDLTELYEIK